MPTARTRLAAISAGLTLTATMLVTPAALAQDDGPADTLMGFADAVNSLDVEALPTYFCLDQADTLGGLPVAELLAGAAVGFDFILDAISIGLVLDSADVVSQTDTEAIVDVSATLSIEFDVEALMPMISAMAEAFGATEEDLADMQEQMMADVPEAGTATIAGEVTLVPGESRAWVICSDLDALMVTSIEDMMGGDGGDGDAEATDS